MRSPGMWLSPFCAAGLGTAVLLLLLSTSGWALTPSSTTSLGPVPAAALPAPAPAITTTHYLPLVAGPPPARLLIAAAHVDSSVSYEPDEAILLWNAGYSPQLLAGWRLEAGNGTATFPLSSTLTLASGERIWCTAEAAAFQRSFGHAPDCVWSEANGTPEAGIVQLDGELRLNNRGGDIQLLDSEGRVVDVLLYGDEGSEFSGWRGLPVQPYTRGAIPQAGQILTRKQHPHTLQPQDSDRAADWSSDLADVVWGRRVRFPGWRGWTGEDGARPFVDETTATVTVAIGPEGLFDTLAATLAGAQAQVDLSIYTLEHPELTELLAAAATRGVGVRVLLEGSPPGGISRLQKWCVARLAAAGADVRYLAAQADAPNGLRPRFSYAHAKYGIVDGHTALVGTDNFNRDSMPVDSAAGGRRGVYLVTDASPVVRELARIFAQDWAPERFADLHPYTEGHERYGEPPADFVLPEPPVYATAEPIFRTAATFSGTARYGVITAPENALWPADGLWALLAQAGPGDEVLVQQLYEHKFWGNSDSNPVADPNPRLEALIAAARRGATVRLLLDSYFDEPEELRSNQATADYVHAVAAAEGLDLMARLGNPTGGGIHAKLVLFTLGDERWSAIGSLNGGEVSHKLNREVVVLLDMAMVHERLAELFWHDWQAEPGANHAHAGDASP